MGEHKFSQIMGLLRIYWETEIDTIPPKHGKSKFSQSEKPMGKHKHFKAMGFLHASCEAVIVTISKLWEK